MCMYVRKKERKRWKRVEEECRCGVGVGCDTSTRTSGGGFRGVWIWWSGGSWLLSGGGGVFEGRR